MSGWVNGRMCFIVLFTVAGSLKTAILETESNALGISAHIIERNTYPVANPPHSASTVCLAIKLSKSNAGSNWSVSVRGYDKKPSWYSFSAICRRS